MKRTAFLAAGGAAVLTGCSARNLVGISPRSSLSSTSSRALSSGATERDFSVRMSTDLRTLIVRDARTETFVYGYNINADATVTMKAAGGSPFTFENAFNLATNEDRDLGNGLRVSRAGNSFAAHLNGNLTDSVQIVDGNSLDHRRPKRTTHIDISHTLTSPTVANMLQLAGQLRSSKARKRGALDQQSFYNCMQSGGTNCGDPGQVGSLIVSSAGGGFDPMGIGWDGGGDGSTVQDRIGTGDGSGGPGSTWSVVGIDPAKVACVASVVGGGLATVAGAMQVVGARLVQAAGGAFTWEEFLALGTVDAAALLGAVAALFTAADWIILIALGLTLFGLVYAIATCSK